MPRSSVHDASRSLHVSIAALTLLTLAAVSACSERLPTAPQSPGQSSLISDAVHGGGTPGFYFLPPMVRLPAYAGTFDEDLATLDPRVTICDITSVPDPDCGGATPAIGSFTRTTTPTITMTDGQYQVNWDTRATGFDAGHTYRLHIAAGAAGFRRELGFADVLLTTSPGQVKNLATDDLIVLQDGRTLPVKVRIEMGILAAITVAPNPVSVVAGESLQLSAVMRDTHGAVISGPALNWSSTAPALATVDASGAVAALEPGLVTITAQANGIAGTASLTIRKAPAGLEIDPASLSQNYDGSPKAVVVTTTPASLTGVAVTYNGSATAPSSAGSYAVLATLNNAHYEASPVSGTLVIAAAGVAVEVSSGGGHACALASDATMACWGANGFGVTNAPPGTYLDVAAGQLHSCGLRTDGSATCWGYGGYSETGTYAGPFVQITAGAVQSCALQPDGVGFCWGGAGPAPAGTYTQLSAGGGFQCGVMTSGALACTANLVPPAGTFIQVSAGWSYACAVRTDHTVACWGGNGFGQATPPSGTFIQVSAAYQHTCGVRTDGTVACWGWDNKGQSTPPAGTFRQVSGGNEFTCGVRTDGFVQCWGDNSAGETDVPAKFAQPAP